MLSGVVHIKEVVSWWGSQISEFVPPPDRRIWASGVATTEVYASRSGFELHRLCSLSQPLEGGTLTAHSRDLIDIGKNLSRGEKIILSFDLTHCFVKTLILPANARRRAADILRMEIEKSTPFDPEAIVYTWDWPISKSRESNTRVNLIVLLRSTLLELAESLSAHGVIVEAIAFRPSGEGAHSSVLGLDFLMYGERRLNLWRRRGIAAGILLIISVTGLVGSIAIKQSQELSAVLAQVEDLKSKATEVRKKIDNAKSVESRILEIQSRKSETLTVAYVVEELSRKLPDSAYLLNLRIEGSSLTLEGRSEVPEELIGALEGSPLLEQVKFSAPVSRAPGQTLASFSITADFSNLQDTPQ